MRAWNSLNKKKLLLRTFALSSEHNKEEKKKTLNIKLWCLYCCYTSLSSCLSSSSTLFSLYSHVLFHRAIISSSLFCLNSYNFFYGHHHHHNSIGIISLMIISMHFLVSPFILHRAQNISQFYHQFDWWCAHGNNELKFCHYCWFNSFIIRAFFKVSCVKILTFFYEAKNA